MNRIAEENPARRIQSFDTVLPDEVRVQFREPKRPPIGRPEPRDESTLWLGCAIVLAAIILGVAIGSARRQEGQHAVPQAPTVSGVPLEQPAAAPPQISVAPRAELLRLPPPRAQLVRLPEWRVGEERPVTMPYGLQVTARLKGNLTSTDMLPTSGNAIGDAWGIGDTAWVWITAPGTASAKWIDP
jgi:hypothetical protein